MPYSHWRTGKLRDGADLNGQHAPAQRVSYNRGMHPSPNPYTRGATLPALLQQRDARGSTALHYAASGGEPGELLSPYLVS